MVSYHKMLPHSYHKCLLFYSKDDDLIELSVRTSEQTKVRNSDHDRTPKTKGEITLAVCKLILSALVHLQCNLQCVPVCLYKIM